MVRETSAAAERPKIRVGAVTYLNARPLIYSLARLAPQVEIVIDLPSRLADALAAGKLDVAMIPSIEYARGRGYAIVSDACIACDGPVRSVKLYSRVPLERLRTLALDEGSRTSAALVQDAAQRAVPHRRRDPAAADRRFVGRRAGRRGDADRRPRHVARQRRLRVRVGLGRRVVAVDRLAVCVCHVDRPAGGRSAGTGRRLAAARDEGTRQLEEIARQAAPDLGIPEADCLSYLRDNLEFRFGRRQRQGLEHFYALAGRQGFAPRGHEVELLSGRIMTSRAGNSRSSHRRPPARRRRRACVAGIARSGRARPRRPTPSPAACTRSRFAPTTSTATSTTRTSAQRLPFLRLFAEAGRADGYVISARRVAPQDRRDDRPGRQPDSLAGRACTPT